MVLWSGGYYLGRLHGHLCDSFNLGGRCTLGIKQAVELLVEVCDLLRLLAGVLGHGCEFVACSVDRRLCQWLFAL